MNDYFLPVENWPKSLFREHQYVLEKVIRQLSVRPDLFGLAAGGSFASGQMDEFSDLDLRVVVDPESWQTVISRRLEIAAGLGPLDLAFTGEHVGLPDMLICLYGEMPIHVDLHFMTSERLGTLSEDLTILWDRYGKLHGAIAAGKPSAPAVRRQWLEDRFWAWIHYLTTRAARGELFQALGYLSFVREQVLGPMVLELVGKPPYGVHHIEAFAGSYAEQMRSTVAGYDRKEILEAIVGVVAMYRELRSKLVSEDFIPRVKAEEVAVRYLQVQCERFGKEDGLTNRCSCPPMIRP
jgi:hypothetical protein